MDYSRIVAVTGIPGLFEVLSSKSDGAIVRSLDDGTTKFIAARVHNLSHLESIEVYTTGDNATLAEVFTAIKESNKQLPDVKDNKALRKYFEEVFPNLDFERVYTSDMKKMINWYKALEKHNIDFTAPAEEAEAGTESESVDSVEEKKINPKKEKVVLEVDKDSVPEEAKVKTRKRKKKEE